MLAGVLAGVSAPCQLPFDVLFGESDDEVLGPIGVMALVVAGAGSAAVASGAAVAVELVAADGAEAARGRLCSAPNRLG